jgi:hypothetical protein
MRDKLMTAGELLRAGQLVPNPAAAVEARQLVLFDKRQGG